MARGDYRERKGLFIKGMMRLMMRMQKMVLKMMMMVGSDIDNADIKGVAINYN